MKATFSALMHSKFYSPAFNSAIFDGPVRIYFSQIHESLALKIYFNLQQRFSHELGMAKSHYKRHGSNILVMIYPSNEDFLNSFGEDESFLAHAPLGSDQVLGIKGPFDDSQLELIVQQVLLCLNKWEKQSQFREQDAIYPLI